MSTAVPILLFFCAFGLGMAIGSSIAIWQFKTRMARDWQKAFREIEEASITAEQYRDLDAALKKSRAFMDEVERRKDEFF